MDTATGWWERRPTQKAPRCWEQDRELRRIDHPIVKWPASSPLESPKYKGRIVKQTLERVGRDIVHSSERT